MKALSECAEAIKWIVGFKIKRKKNLLYLLQIAAMITITTGVLLSIIDPAVHSPLEGIWAAWGTITHVGFGDVAPTSFLGRLLAGLLILVGLILLSLFTATLSVEFIGRDVNKLGNNVERVKGAENQILEEIERLHQRMSEIEKKLP